MNFNSLENVNESAPRPGSLYQLESSAATTTQLAPPIAPRL